MNTRIVVASLIGGAVIFFWGFVAHTMLPLGDIGVGQATDEDAVLMAMKTALPTAGVYYLPGIAPDKMNDEAASKAYSAKALSNPNAFVVYQPQGQDGMAMGDELATELVTNVISALVAAWIMSLASGSGRRIAVAVALGTFAWLTVSVPYWNWYRFPLDFTLASLVEHLIGWTLAGSAMAWWLGRQR